MCMWRHVHLRDMCNLLHVKNNIRVGGVGELSLKPFHCLLRLVHVYKGHLNRDGPDQRRGGAADVRDTEATGGAEATAGGGKAVGGIRDGHGDLLTLHPTPEERYHLVLHVLDSQLHGECLD